jgi:hypothetical protein
VQCCVAALKENKIGRIFSIKERDKKFPQILFEKIIGGRTLLKLKRIWKNNIKILLKSFLELGDWRI